MDTGSEPGLIPVAGGRVLVGIHMGTGASLVPLKGGGMAPIEFSVQVVPDSDPSLRVFLEYQVVEGEIRFVSYRLVPIPPDFESPGVFRELSVAELPKIRASWIEAGRDMVTHMGRAFLAGGPPSMRNQRRGPNPPSRSELKSVHELHEAGKSYAEIGKELNISRSSAHRWHRLWSQQQKDADL